MSVKKVVFKCQGKYCAGCSVCPMIALYHRNVLSQMCVKMDLRKGDIITITVRRKRK